MSNFTIETLLTPDHSSVSVPDPASSIIIIPSGSGEILHYIVSQMSSLFALTSLTARDIAKEIKKITKSLIRTEHSEVFYLEGRTLFSVHKNSPSSQFEISDKSLVGFVATNKIFQIFNNPHASALYTSFPEETLPFSKGTNSFINPTTVCAVPICYPNSRELFGVLMLYNRLDTRQEHTAFSANDVHIIESIGTLLTGHLHLFALLSAAQDRGGSLSSVQGVRRPNRSDSFDLKLNTIENIVMKGRRYKMLQQWCKQIFYVTNIVERKLILAKNILQKIYGEPTPVIFIESALQLITATVNAEAARLAVKRDEGLLVFSLEDGLTINCCTSASERLLESALSSEALISYTAVNGLENILFCPVHDKHTFVIEVSNKKDVTMTTYVDFNKEDEGLLLDIGKALSSMVSAYFEQSSVAPTELRNKLKYYVNSLNSHPIISTIRTASQQLLNCDRGTVFLREKEQMVVQSQGIEYDIPVGFSVPVGKGIVGYVAQVGVMENVEDAYQDERFNPEVDDLTGYCTKSILCMPVFNNDHQVIGALQMINKVGGKFTKNDEETLDLFSGMVSSVLMNCELFQRTMEERTRLINILNSIGTYILVLDAAGKLDYCNKFCDTLLGVTDKFAQNNHYSAWLDQNKQLMMDVNMMYSNPTEPIYKRSQVLTRKGTDYEYISGIFNYNILALQEISGESAGTIIILEDATALEELNFKYKVVKSQLIALSTPVEASNALQKCISKLENILRLPASSAFADDILEITALLKRGNLYKAEIKLPTELKSLETSLKSRIREYNDDPTPHTLSFIKRFTKLYSLEIPTAPCTQVTQDLNNWSLDFFSVTDHFAYIEAMFARYALIAHFEIDRNKLLSFVRLIEHHYSIGGNPYHNFTHGISVMHSTFLLLTFVSNSYTFSELELLAILLGALCHDVGHTGRTNLFEINKNTPLAVLYNDISVLENHHAALTFEVLKQSDSSILSQVPQNLFKEIRKLVIKSILGTDMSKHFQMIAGLTTRLSDTADCPIGSLQDDCEKLAAYIVHSADLSHPTKTLELYEKWSRLVCQEFTGQVQEELALCLPLSEFMMGLEDPIKYYKNEIGFLTVIVRPLWECLGLWLSPFINELVSNVDNNLAAYKDRLMQLEQRTE